MNAIWHTLSNIKVVLSRPSHPSNIGSAARALKTMGLSQLVIVAPHLIATPMTPHETKFVKNQKFTLPEESYTLAAGATDILDNAQFFADLPSALADCSLSYALSARRRELTCPPQTPREAAPVILSAAQQGEKVAIVFGNERFGLSIEEVAACNRLMTITGNPQYCSLNLSQAVQIVAYELLAQSDFTPEHTTIETLATQAQVDGFLGHLNDVMQSVGFFERRNGARLMRKMEFLFRRSALQCEEIDILRGFLKTLQKKL